MKSSARRPAKAAGRGGASARPDIASAQLSAAETLAGLGNWRWSPPSPLFEASAGLMRILGRRKRAARLAVRPILRTIPASQRARLIAALRARRPARLDLELKQADGARKVLALSLEPEGDGVWGVVQDVTALSSISTALDRSESRWEMALESAGQAVWDSDLVTGEVYHSRTWRAMRGMSPTGDVRDTHEDWVARVHPADIERIQALIDKQHSGELERVAFEYRERRPDGRYMWIASLGKPVEWFPDGRPRRIVGTDMDITQRKLAEAEMARLSRRLGLALEVSGLGIFEADLETGELYWDRRVREMYGFPADMAIAHDLWERCLHPEDRDAAIARVGEAVERKGRFESDFRIVRPDGEVRHIHTVGAWYCDADGAPKMLGLNWDVTDEVIAKRDLERARNLAEARNAELEAAKARIEYNALHDALTGLPNRRYLDQHLGECASWARRTRGAVSLVHIDLDLFKQINDTLGHVAGDAMLVHVARFLRATAAPEDFVARVGGDEFVILRRSERGADPTLAGLASSIVEGIRQPVDYNGRECRFGASIGIATQRGPAVDPERLLIEADIALYRAKGLGKNRFEFFGERLAAEARRGRRIAGEITSGLEANAFFPVYQPLFDARTLAIVGVEALARWRHPARGVLPPSDFLREAENLNLLTAIDKAILEQALAQFDVWRKAGLSVPSISVNVSFRRLHDHQLIEHLRALDVEPGTLAFELVESTFLERIDDIARWNLDHIRDLGIDISVDDFGAGHASIVGLLKLKPKRLKLDRQFLSHITTSTAQRRLVRSIIGIGRSLGIAVAAEGVETREQADVLTNLGCDILQGFAFARPMPAEDFAPFLAEGGWRRAS